VGFHAQKGARRKKARAGVVYQRGKMCIWDTGLDRFGPDEPIPDRRVKLETLRLSTARGESEPVQLCVTTPEPLEDLAVAVGDLVGSDGARLSGSHVEVQYVGSATNGFNECVQDIVRPEFRTANAKNSFVLLTAAIPRYAGAGVYRGRVTLTVNGTTDIEVPVALRVYGFELPRVASFKSSFCVSPNYIAPYYNRPDRPRMTRHEILAISMSPGSRRMRTSTCCRDWPNRPCRT